MESTGQAVFWTVQALAVLLFPMGAGAVRVLAQGCFALRRRARAGFPDYSDALLKSALAPAVTTIAVPPDASPESRQFARRLLDLHFGRNEVVIVLDGPSEVEMETWRNEFKLYQSARPVERKLPTAPVRGVYESRDPIRANASKTVKLDPAAEPALRLRNPKLWWPNGYGDPNLYRVELEFAAGGAVSDSKSFNAGVRRFTYSEEGGALRIFINGRRFVARGGNWGFPESMLRYRAREYDAAVRYHRDMNFTMIRNWVGQTGDEAFYDACDRYGIVVWQDFWLAN